MKTAQRAHYLSGAGLAIKNVFFPAANVVEPMTRQEWWVMFQKELQSHHRRRRRHSEKRDENCESLREILTKWNLPKQHTLNSTIGIYKNTI